MTSRPRALAAAGALVLLVAPTCVDYQDGIVVDVVILHYDGQRGDETPPVNPAGAPRRFTTDLGYTVELEHGHVVIESVQLVACAEDFLWPSGLAHAHEQSGDPTLLGVPYVESAARADFAPGAIGAMEPPPGRYCEARVVIGPADADALALPADIDMVGRSLYLEGNYRPPGAEETYHFIIESSDSRELRVPLVDAYRGRPAPLLLDAGHRDARLALADLTNFWLDGVDLAHGRLPDKARQALDAIALTIHHHPGP